MKTIMLFGASSAIAQAYIKHLGAQPGAFNIITISSTGNNLESTHDDNNRDTDSHVYRHFETDYSADSLAAIIATLTKPVAGKDSEKDSEKDLDLSQVVIFNGQLHYPKCDVENTAQQLPERKLEEFNEHYFNQLMHSNTLVPLLCLQSVLPLLNHKTHCTITALSARVGSINDNKLGGWYSYRASKAALNMLIQTAAIELQRRAKNTKLILFHPGTTDTELSKPFQRNVPAEKLFSPAFVAAQLYDLTCNNPTLELNGEAAYFDWQGRAIAW